MSYTVKYKMNPDGEEIEDKGILYPGLFIGDINELGGCLISVNWEG